MTNVELARLILTDLVRAGVREVVFCPGARNAPFVAWLGSGGIRAHSFFEERSAGFFAIGRMQATGRPVAVCTTSGTAVAELLPAVVEADYQGLPLIVLSADRPRRFRGSASPQTIIQPGIFSHYVERSWDIENEFGGFHEPLAGLARPAHVNVCFDEPLIDGSVSTEILSAEMDVVGSVIDGRTDWNLGAGISLEIRRPLVIVGRLSRADALNLEPILRRWNRPVYLEGHAQLRGAPGLAHLEIQGGEDSLSSLDIDGVIRIGDVPTLRFWRDLERSQLTVWNFSRRPFTGLARENSLFAIEAVANVRDEFEQWNSEERARDRDRARLLEDLLLEFPLSETAWIRRVSGWLPSSARLFLGNSLPIREWDLAADRSARPEIFGNRGTNGIDGLISTFLGVSEPGAPNWALIGDLSALYDLAGPWVLRNLQPRAVQLVVVNNGGGRIFKRMFHDPRFENSHDLNFQAWAGMWNWNYLRLSELGESPAADEDILRPRVIEVVPNADQTDAFWRSWSRARPGR